LGGGSVTVWRWTADEYAGELHGYHVHIGPFCNEWCVWLMPGGEWTERCLRVGSLAEGAKLAREWIEKRLRKADFPPD
jgi:hypothetical protein